ncbi:uncharacterized protein ARMOST_10584 [Armillaria ostoyae]|uniref:Uncharacterized protein n=1 Tax=Armillaria ostoyae TaxID=47428 RepID=A0A284REP3_ARMOS|nr:uncharacterized protein ARMOST_10584 [Armillaria ostoyae]
MSFSIEYCHSVTPKLYEPTPTPPELTFEEYKVLMSEQASVEENDSVAMGVHEEWKVVKAKEAYLEKLKVDKEAQAEKLKVLQKKKEEQKAEEKWQVDEKECLQLADLQQKADATVKKKQDDLQKKKEKEEKEAVKRAEEAAAAELLREEKEMDVDTKEEMSESSKENALKKLKEIWDRKQKVMAPAVSTVEKNKKRKRATKSASVVESEAEEVPGPSKRVKMEVSGPVEGEEELSGSKRCMHCRQDSEEASVHAG